MALNLPKIRRVFVSVEVCYMTKKENPDGLTIAIRIVIILIALTLIPLLIRLAFYGYDDYQKRVYRIDYSEIVENMANEYNLDKYLIYAVIKTESGFNSDAVSEVGARGLMQITKDTFEWIRDHRLRDDEDVNFDDMFEPEKNIQYGVYLISYHMGYYNNTDNSLAAYHAGDGAVDGWLKDARYSKDGKTLSVIPISDTAHYVEKVNKAYKTYLKLYKE